MEKGGTDRSCFSLNSAPNEWRTWDLFLDQSVHRAHLETK